jgi:hypothetical protein
MKLAPNRTADIFASSGNYATEICDRCGQLLGCLRWTRRGETGEWCSQTCRDGAFAAQSCALRREGKTAVLIPGKHKSIEDRSAARLKQGALRQKRSRERKTASQVSIFSTT